MASLEDDLAKADILLAEFEYGKARKKFNDIIKANSKCAQAYFGKAEASLGEHKVKAEEIQELYQKAIDLEPDNVYFITSLGAFWIEIGRFNDAEELYTKATELDEENAGMYFSEFAMGYAMKAPIVMEKFLDDNTRMMIKKKSFTFMLKALDLSEEEAKNILTQ